MDIAQTGFLAVGLGLLAFVEPCSVGSHLLFLKFLDRLSTSQRLYQTLLFTLARAALMAGLGVLAAIVGSQFLDIQHGLWVALGSLYIAIGLAYLAGGAPWLIRQSDRVLPRIPVTSGAALGVLFGINIPACAAPLLAVLLGGAAVQAATGGEMVYGGVSLLIFGLALSSPLVLAVFTERGRRLLNAIARFTARMPRVTGAVLVLLGFWSVALAYT